ncbi:YoaK family protein [Pelistega sp. MC2]|uniref:YoaK family protein n=1 Tax=Pelistega sp. MC2 TaxID=1720297 RepID=UPI0008D9316D|nr:YoaK family protein [Pelistega sp. MC2]
MLLAYSKRLTGKARTYSANTELVCFLSFVAGAINAGGFLAVQQYTSHMSGIVSHMSDMIALGEVSLVLWGFGALLAFIAGSATTAVIINLMRHLHLQSEYALPIFIEACALMFFGLLDGIRWEISWLWTSLTVATLCYIMGLQNAISTDISQYALRTTHVTGTVTDMGMEIGKMLYWNRASKKDINVPPVHANIKKLKLLVQVLFLFFLGGIAGAYGFKTFGFLFTCFLASVLAYLSSGPLFDDIKTIWHRFNEPAVIIEQNILSTLADEKEMVISSAELAEAEEIEMDQQRQLSQAHIEPLATQQDIEELHSAADKSLS